jgi:hypothetical protein
MILLLGLSHPLFAQDSAKPMDHQQSIVHQSVHALTETIVHDTFSPPVASRVYAYSLVAYYEGLFRQEAGYQSYLGQLHGLQNLPQPDETKTYNWLLVGTQAFFETASKLVFSSNILDEKRQTVMAQFETMNIAQEEYDRSIQYANLLSSQIMAWSKADNYGRTRSMRRYVVKSGEDAWKPTPPDYMASLEPNWGKLRPFVMDSTSQFRVEPPPKFDLTKDTPYETELMRVYNISKTLTDEQKWITDFWDDNPFSVQHQGHLAFAIKKISPGAHWIGITEMAATEKGSSLVQTAAAYSMVSVALADAFIACWEQKYHDQFVRPVTVIRKYIDPEWQPMLQTPPFPEHTSGHSAISMSAATVLTKLYGASFSFKDRSEETYGIRPRTFNSFEEAAAEAGMSRLYGGIHYLTGIDAGRRQGKKVGTNVLQKVRLKD